MVVVIGLYLLIWGKEEERDEADYSQKHNTNNGIDELPLHNL